MNRNIRMAIANRDFFRRNHAARPAVLVARELWACPIRDVVEFPITECLIARKSAYTTRPFLPGTMTLLVSSATATTVPRPHQRLGFKMYYFARVGTLLDGSYQTLPIVGREKTAGQALLAQQWAGRSLFNLVSAAPPVADVVRARSARFFSFDENLRKSCFHRSPVGSFRRLTVIH